MIWNCERDLAVADLPTEAPVAKEQDPSAEQSTAQSAVPMSQLTVGRPFMLRCKGDPMFFQAGSLQLKATHKSKPTDTPAAEGKTPPADDPYALKLLKVERVDEKSADLLVTSYRVGTNDLQVVLSDGAQQVELAFEPLTVASVIKPQPGQTPQPYGPFGPFAMSWPLYYWWILGGLIAALLATVIYQVVSRLRRRARIKRLAKYDTALAPVSQFNKELRLIHRELELSKGGEREKSLAAMTALNQSFRLYLIRQLRLPTLEWKDRAWLKEFKKLHKPVYLECGKDLQIVLRELAQLETKRDRLNIADCKQMSLLCRKTVERVSRASKEKDEARIAAKGARS